MKYHLFAGSYYYPLAGLGDYKGVFDSEEAAQAAFDFSEEWAVIAVPNPETGELVAVWEWEG